MLLYEEMGENFENTYVVDEPCVGAVWYVRNETMLFSILIVVVMNFMA